MRKFKAKVNLTLGVPGDKHRHVKKGEVFECEESYFDEHLDEQGHVEEAGDEEEVTSTVKAQARKLTKAEKKAAEKKAKEEAAEAKRAAKADKD